MGAGNEMAENIHRPVWSLTVGTASNLDFIRIKLTFDVHLSDPLYLLTGSELRVLRRGILFIDALKPQQNVWEMGLCLIREKASCVDRRWSLRTSVRGKVGSENWEGGLGYRVPELRL